MTTEEKDLLRKDLCARFPYGVIVSVTDGTIKYKAYIESVSYKHIQVSPAGESIFPAYTFYKISEVKPYLRPLSSMTEEEKKEYGKVCELDTEILANHPMNGEPFPALYNSQDWLNKYHFDYRGLIPKGLAIEVTEENNPYKK